MNSAAGIGRKLLFASALFFFAIFLNSEAIAATNIYSSPPTFSPYYAGVVKQSVLEEALAEVNYLRTLAGVPGDLTLNSDYTNKAQHGAVLMDANGVMSHYPEKPADMPEDFYNLGYDGTSHSNIHYQWTSYNNARTGNDSLSVAIKGWMDDSDSGNIAHVGHRRWILNPNAKQTGFGISSRGGYSAMYVVGQGREYAYDYNYILWPVKSNHPLRYFDIKVPWSITLNGSIYEKCDDGVQVTLTRNSDGKTWRFSSARSDGHFNIDDSIYEDCIIFRPDGVGIYKNGESWSVEVTGLRKNTGETDSISYMTTFSGSDNPESDDCDNPEYWGGCDIGLGAAFLLLAAFSAALMKKRPHNN
jgi:uncharacterized protein YkwD